VCRDIDLQNSVGSLNPRSSRDCGGIFLRYNQQMRFVITLTQCTRIKPDSDNWVSQHRVVYVTSERAEAMELLEALRQPSPLNEPTPNYHSSYTLHIFSREDFRVDEHISTSYF